MVIRITNWTYPGKSIAFILKIHLLSRKFCDFSYFVFNVFKLLLKMKYYFSSIFVLLWCITYVFVIFIEIVGIRYKKSKLLGELEKHVLGDLDNSKFSNAKTKKVMRPKLILMKHDLATYPNLNQTKRRSHLYVLFSC